MVTKLEYPRWLRVSYMLFGISAILIAVCSCVGYNISDIHFGPSAIEFVIISLPVLVPPLIILEFCRLAYKAMHAQQIAIKLWTVFMLLVMIIVSVAFAYQFFPEYLIPFFKDGAYYPLTCVYLYFGDAVVNIVSRLIALAKD